MSFSETCRALLALLVCLVTLPAPALEVGQPVPALEIALADGSVFKLAEARGQVVVINLWATWCTFCREEMPALETYYQQHRDAGLKMIAVSLDEPAEEAQAGAIMRAYSYTAGIGRLSKLKPLGRIWRLPMTFVIDRNGILRRDGSAGEPKVDLATLEREVTPLLK